MKQKDFLLPFLKIIGDMQEHTVEDVAQKLAEQFRVNEEVRRMKHSGGNSVYVNLIAWCKVSLGKAKFIADTQPGRFRITPLGLEELRKNPSEITVEYLTSFSKPSSPK